MIGVSRFLSLFSGTTLSATLCLSLLGGCSRTTPVTYGSVGDPSPDAASQVSDKAQTDDLLLSEDYGQSIIDLLNATVGEGQMVDAGGHQLFMRTLGSGSHTIVFDAGASADHRCWSHIMSAVAKNTRAVSYDRAGIGKSEAGSKPRSAMQVASELRTALKNAGESPPFILVGHSLGGLFATVFAAAYPDEVTALVLVDPATVDFYDLMQTSEAWEANVQRSADTLSIGALGELEALEVSKEQMSRSWPIPNMPVTVVTGMKPTGEWPFATAADMELWKASHEALIDSSPGAVHFIDAHSDHISLLWMDAIVDVILEYAAE